MQINEAKLAYYLTLTEKTQSQLAELTGVSRNTIYSIKKGRRCSDEVGNKIAKALGVDVTEIIETK